MAADDVAPVAGDDGLLKVILGVGNLVSLAVSVLKDGAQLQDLATVGQKLISDPVFLKSVEDAIGAIGEVPAEVKAITIAEGADLIKALYDQVVAIAAAAKK